LTVIGGAPQILTDIPASQFFYAGRQIVLSVTVGGTAPFTYQWQKNGVNLSNGGRISGATSNVLTIAYAGSADAGNYQLLINNGQGSAQSTLSALSVQAVPQLNTGGAGWTLQGSTTPPTMNTGNVGLTTGAGNTASAVFYNAPLYIGAFNASFVYTDVGGGGADGATFCIQNDVRGPAARAAVARRWPALDGSGQQPAAPARQPVVGRRGDRGCGRGPRHDPGRGDAGRPRATGTRPTSPRT
jgi:hypothetical protein